MTSSAAQIRTYSGPAILSFGFRPFFLLASAWTVVSMALSAAMMSAHFTLPLSFAVIDWHVHEQLFGYLPAVIAGFLLTAVPNWTGRLPVTGTPLLTLVLAWLAGRVAVLLSAHGFVIFTAICDLSFLFLFAFVIGREVLMGRNWRNLKVLVLVGLMAAGNGIFHIEAASTGVAANGYGARLGLAVAVMLIVLIGGRIVPSFTRNWLVRRVPPSRLPVSFNRFDTAAVAIAAAALILWVFLPDRDETAWLCTLAGGFQFVRLLRWAGHRTVAERLVLVLHVGYAFVPLGFILVGLAVLWPYSIVPNAAVHAWTAGAVGVMTLAVMTRASLGHSGQPLTANRTMEFSYALIVAGAALRIASGLALAPSWLVELAAIAWVLGFGLFVIQFAPLLMRPRATKG